MKIGVVVQARMSSRRLPGKVLMNLAGKPLLKHLLEGLRRSSLADSLIVATSGQPSDDPVAAFCEQEGVGCYRGELDDVAARLLGAADSQGWDALVRICGDSPLLDWRLVDRAVKIYQASEYDLVTNAYPRTFPKGQSVEVVRLTTLRQLHGKMSFEEREHVTQYYYSYPEDLRIKNFNSGGKNWDKLSFCVDTEEDFKRIAGLMDGVQRQVWGYRVEDLVPWQS